MSITNNKTHISTVNDDIHSQNLAQRDTRNFSHPWGINPITYLEEVRQRSRINKFLTLKESFTSLVKSSNVEQQQENISDVTDTLELLRTKRALLLDLKGADIESATQYGTEIMIIIANLLLHVVQQIGQTNVQTTTLESIIAYIRSLIHTRSAHMRQTIPGPLLIAWYEVSNLMSSLKNEPELRITKKKAKQLLDIAQDTAVWAHKHLSTKRLNDEQIGFTDRSSILYTYE